jgi:LysM repeat protein
MSKLLYFAVLLALLASVVHSLDQTNKVTDVNTLDVEDPYKGGGNPKPKPHPKPPHHKPPHHPKPKPQPPHHKPKPKPPHHSPKPMPHPKSKPKPQHPHHNPKAMPHPHHPQPQPQPRPQQNQPNHHPEPAAQTGKHHTKPGRGRHDNSNHNHHDSNNKHHDNNNHRDHSNNNNNEQAQTHEPAPVRDSNYCQYTVQSGDSLSGIGAQLGVDWQTLASINGISDPNLIYAGQVLNYPCSGGGGGGGGGDDGGGGGGGGDSRGQLVACGQALYNNRYNEVYSQSASRWQGINNGIYPPSTPTYSDCSSAVSWCYWTVFGNGPDIINNANWGGGYTGTMASNGWAIDCSDLQPGDVILYGSGSPWDHVEMYMGNGKTVSHGADPVSYESASSLQGFASNQCRRYFN